MMEMSEAGTPRPGNVGAKCAGERSSPRETNFVQVSTPPLATGDRTTALLLGEGDDFLQVVGGQQARVRAPEPEARPQDDAESSRRRRRRSCFSWMCRKADSPFLKRSAAPEGGADESEKAVSRETQLRSLRFGLRYTVGVMIVSYFAMKRHDTFLLTTGSMILFTALTILMQRTLGGTLSNTLSFSPSPLPF